VLQQEYVQVLRYEKGQKYDHHTDYFDPRFYQSDPETLKTIKGGEQNRLATVLWYLSTVTDGGQTVFPRAFGSTPDNSSDCSTGLLVPPVRGQVVMFYSLTADGALDPMSVHGACPVGEGVKNAGNKWVWTNNLREEEYDEEDDEESDEEDVEEYVEDAEIAETERDGEERGHTEDDDEYGHGQEQLEGAEEGQEHEEEWQEGSIRPEL
jgi:hypothetical protein